MPLKPLVHSESGSWKALIGTIFLGILLIDILYCTVASHHEPVPAEHIIAPQAGYGDETGMSVLEVLKHRVSAHPFHLVSSIIFLCAIIHTFFANSIARLAHDMSEKAHQKRVDTMKASGRFKLVENLEKSPHFAAEVLHFFGEVEVIFGLWVIPLMLSIGMWFDWSTAVHYLDTRNYTEPLFVFCIMTIASTRPIIRYAEACLKSVASLGGGSPGAWWLATLTIGPLMGSLITEPAAMTISALILAKKFYELKPSRTLRYATLGLLFVNVSVGGVLTHFAAPPVLMVAAPWGWTTGFMLTHFGWKAVIGIFISTAIYYTFFKKEFTELYARKKEFEKENPHHEQERKEAHVPGWITIIHLSLLAWTVIHSHHPVIFMGTFMLFLGFYQATAPHQTNMSLRPSLLVAFFLGGLVIHGGLQGWWISPIMTTLTEKTLLGVAVLLTAFNDNAAVTYLTTLIPNFDPALKYAVVAGAVTGGGLTVIANAPNPAGQSLLSRYFNQGVSPLNLALSALVPTAIMACCFLFL